MIGPLASPIADDLAVPHAFVGLLTTLPILAMGLCSALGPLLASLVGVRRAVLVAIGAIAVLGLARSIDGGPALLLVLTVALGISVGAAGTLPSVIARSAASPNAGLAGGVVASGIVLGATLSAAMAVPLADWLGHWRFALAALSLPAVLSVPLLARLIPVAPAATRTRSSDWRVGRRPVVLLLTLIFGLQAMVYWSITAWLPGALAEHGWPIAEAALMVGVVNLAALSANVLIVVLSDRLGERRRQILTSAICIGLSSLILATLPPMALFGSLAIGLGLGAIFPLLFIATVETAADPAEAGQVAAVVLGGGYVIAAVGPTALGLLRDVSGGHQLGLAAIAAVGCLVALAAGALQLTPMKPRLPGHPERSARP